MPAFVNDPEFIFQKMKANGYKFYKVANLIRSYDVYDTNHDTPDISLDDSIKNLSYTLANVSGAVSVVISKRPASGTRGGNVRKDILRFEYRNNEAEELNPKKQMKETTANNGIYNPRGLDMKLPGQTTLEVIMSLMAQNHQQAMDFMKAQYEFADKMKAKDAEAIAGVENNPIIMRTLNILEKMFTPQNSQPAPKVQIAGHPENKNNMSENNTPQKPQLNAEDQKALNWAIHTLLANDPEFISNLVKLAKLSQDKASIYKMAVLQLNSL